MVYFTGESQPHEDVVQTDTATMLPDLPAEELPGAEG